MSRIIGVFILLVLILMGCTPKENDIVNQTRSEKSTTRIDEKTEKLTVNSENFHFVADWLTDTKIVFVEKDDTAYLVKTFDVATGKVDTLFEESVIIVDVLVHPSKKLLLLHTTADSSSAIVKIISVEGNILDEISIASSELAIEWNDLDAELLLLTAFYEDWTFDVFLYNGKLDKFDLISLENPFPKWLGSDTIATILESDSSLGGDNLLLYDCEMKKREHSTMKKVHFFDTYKDSLLTVQLDEEEKAMYTISNGAGLVTSNWTMPAVSNYAEWLFPEIHWLSSSTILLSSAVKGGQLNQLLEPHKLVRVTEGRQEPILDKVAPGSLSCSPDGEKCLAGFSKDNLIDIKTKKENVWLLLQN